MELKHMSKNANTQNRTIDRTAPRGTQFTPVVNDARTFLQGKGKTVALPVTFTTQGVMNWTTNPQKDDDRTAWTPTKTVTYTRAQVKQNFSRMISCMHDFCSATFATNIPNRTKYSEAELVKFMGLTYTVTKGANKGVVRNHLAHFNAVMYNAIKRNIKADQLDEAIENGDAWAADGVVDKEGNLIAHTTEAKAKKAWARVAHKALVEATKDGPANKRVTGEWWEPKTRKTAYMNDAVVFEYNSNGNLNMTILRGMPSATVRNLAKKAGAPDSVTTGAGATNRCIEWFSIDTTRMSLAQQ